VQIADLTTDIGGDFGGQLDRELADLQSPAVRERNRQIERRHDARIDRGPTQQRAGEERGKSQREDGREPILERGCGVRN